MTDFFADPVEVTVLGGPVRVHRGEVARDDAVPVVLLHGAMLDTGAGVWHDVAPALAAEREVWVVDLPRHGGSRPWGGVLDHAFFLRFVDALLDALALPRVAVVGLSMGGGIGLGYALARPDRVAALVAIGPGGLDATRPYQFLTWLLLRTPGLLRLTSSWLARSPKRLRATMAEQLVAGEQTAGFDRIVALVEQEARAKAQHRENALDDWQVTAYGPRRMRLDLMPQLPELQVPTLWLRGEQDPLVTAEVLAAAHRASPGSQLVTVPGAAHIATYDQPGVVTAQIRQFLADHPI